jgi:hypothetical protein
MRYYVAIDDTDQEGDDGQNKGTGAKSRALAKELVELTGALHLGITRHQLLLDPAIPYTSHNSSACIVLGSDADPGELIPLLLEASSTYLTYVASPGADVGLSVAEESEISPAVVEWGRRAKREVLSPSEAHSIAADDAIELVGLTGERVGVVGALAAVGLRRSGDDGRFLELMGLRGLVGEQPAAVFIEAGVERFLAGTLEVELEPGELIAVGRKHAQPVLLGGRPTLLLDPESSRPDWRAMPRELVRQY